MKYNPDRTFARENDPISIHPTMNGDIFINWRTHYEDDFCCPFCGHQKLKFYSNLKLALKIVIHCNKCRKQFRLSCRNKRYIYRYQPHMSCPNPLCSKKRPKEKINQEWIFITGKRKDRAVATYTCRWCEVAFTGGTEHQTSWFFEDKIETFSFEKDYWDLRAFLDDPVKKGISFSTLTSDWYKHQVKTYIYQLLRTKTYSSSYTIAHINSALTAFSKFIISFSINRPEDISRDSVLAFIDSLSDRKAKTINDKLGHLKRFLEWLNLDASILVKRRDFPKRIYDDPEWLDESVREQIKANLYKVPTPIARQYLVQLYTAARVGEVCKLSFECLLNENGQWYIKYFQEKSRKWQQIPADREIRRVIEAQQEWIRENIGEEYKYLFCHFRGIVGRSYPCFPGMRPLPEHPRVPLCNNPMVKIIRLLIQNENVRDQNGKTPHFTGKITRSSKLQEVRVKYGIDAAQLYAGHQSSNTTFQHYTPPTIEDVARIDLPFQALLVNPDNIFLPWQSLPDSLLKNPKFHELDTEISPRLVVYGHCALDPHKPCPYDLFPKCYGCKSFRPSTEKLPLYERQYLGEKQRMEEAKRAGIEIPYEEAKSVVDAMDKWLPELRGLSNGKE